MNNMKKKIGIVIVALLILFGLSRIDFKSPEAYYNQDATTEQLTNKDDESTTLNGKLQNSNSLDGSDNSAKNNSHSDDKTFTPNKKSGNNNTGAKNENINVSIYIDVKNLLKKENYKKLKPEVRKYVPKNGLVLAKTTIQVPKDSSVFDVLQKATRLNRIQMEYQGANENIYNSVYIQGLNHIYEFSAGSESGWVYSVNNTFPNYGMSAYKVKDGQTIRVVYTVDLGCDVGHSIKQC